MWATSSDHTQDGRTTCTFFSFLRFVCRPWSATQQRRSRTQRESRMKVERKLKKNQSNIDEKLMKFQSWAVLGAQGHFRDAPGCAQDGSETPKSLPRADLGAPRASQEQPGVLQKCPQAGSETHPGRIGALPKRVRHTEQCETRSQNDFATFLRRYAEVRSLKFMRPRSVS